MQLADHRVPTGITGGNAFDRNGGQAIEAGLPTVQASFGDRNEWGHRGFSAGIPDFHLAALVDAASRVSDNCPVKRFSENTPMTMPKRLNDTEREKADGEAAVLMGVLAYRRRGRGSAEDFSS